MGLKAADKTARSGRSMISGPWGQRWWGVSRQLSLRSHHLPEILLASRPLGHPPHHWVPHYFRPRLRFDPSRKGPEARGPVRWRAVEAEAKVVA